jgi:hypothetical protein
VLKELLSDTKGSKPPQTGVPKKGGDPDGDEGEEEEPFDYAKVRMWDINSPLPSEQKLLKSDITLGEAGIFDGQK